MPNFSGELIHVKHITQTFPAANVADTANETSEFESEIFPASFFKLGQVKLPILKGWKIWFYPNLDLAQKLDVSGDGMLVRVRLYNADSDDNDDDNFLDEISGYVALTTDLSHFQTDSWVSNIMLNDMTGILLRPTITIETYLENESGVQIDADSLDFQVILFIDWIDVTEHDLEEYLKELWLAEEFD